MPPQLALHGPPLVAFGAQLHKTKPTELPVGAPMPGALESTVSESRQHEPGPLSVPGRSRGAQPTPPQLTLHGPLIVAIKPSRIKESPPSCLLLHRSMPRCDRRANGQLGGLCLVQLDPEGDEQRPVKRELRWHGLCAT